MAKRSSRRPPSRASASAPKPVFEPDHRYSVMFSAATLADLEPIMKVAGVDLGCRHPHIIDDRGTVKLPALVPGRVLVTLAAEKRWKTEVLADQTRRAPEALKLVGKGNRFAQRDALPRGAGRLTDQRKG